MGGMTSKGASLAPKDARSEGKSRMSLIPMDVLEKYLIPAYEEGVIKYERESWRCGFKISEMYDALLRHGSLFFHRGEDIDLVAEKETGVKKHHLGAMIFCCISMAHSLDLDKERGGGLDDRGFVDEEPAKRVNEVVVCGYSSMEAEIIALRNRLKEKDEIISQLETQKKEYAASLDLHIENSNGKIAYWKKTFLDMKEVLISSEEKNSKLEERIEALINEDDRIEIRRMDKDLKNVVIDRDKAERTIRLIYDALEEEQG